jgi:hypothetical protein
VIASCKGGWSPAPIHSPVPPLAAVPWAAAALVSWATPVLRGFDVVLPALVGAAHGRWFFYRGLASLLPDARWRWCVDDADGVTWEVMRCYDNFRRLLP